MRELAEIRKQFEEIMQEKNSMKKNKQLAELMTELEREHGISAMFENKPSQAFDLYLDISNARVF